MANQPLTSEATVGPPKLGPGTGMPSGGPAACWRWLAWLLPGLIILGSSLWLGWLARQRFDFFDMSSFLDAGYRVYRGQEIYRDFYYIAGPIHPYMHAVSFWLLGFTQKAVVAHLLVINAGYLLLVYRLSRRVLPASLAWLPLLGAATVFYGPVAHPWYDQNAIFWITLGVWAMDQAGHALNGRRAHWWSALAGACAVLALMTKTNFGAGAGLTLAALALCTPRTLAVFSGYCLGCALAVLLILWRFDGVEMVYQALLAYPTKHRLSDLARLWQAYRHATPGAQVTLWLLLLLIFSRGQAWRQGRRDCVLLLGLLGTAILGAWTSSMNPAGNLGLLGLQLTVMARLAWRVAPMPWPAPPTRYWRWGLLALTRAWLPVLLLVAAYTGWERRQFIWSWNSANQNNSYRLQTPAFAGWRCDPALGAGTDEAVQAIQRLVPARDSLLILPYGTWIYGLLGRDSYTPAPFIFHEGELPFPGEKAAAFRQQLLTDPPAWLLLHDHQTVWFSTASGILTWLDLRDWLQQSYQPVWHFGRWHLLRHPQRASDGLRLPQPAGPPAGDAGPPIPAGKPPDLTARVWMVPGIDLKMVPVLPGALARPGQAAGPAPPPTQPYWIAVYELTQRQYGLLMGDNPSHWRDPWGPVESISWRAAMGVALRLTRREQAAGRLPAGYAYRLPTAAEWAYAAGGGRAGEHRGDSGSDDLDALAWHAGNSQDRPQWPGKKLPNALGLYDLSGNVAEWCLEPLAGAGQAPPLVASGPAPGAMRLVLGGSFGDAPEAWRGGPPARSLAPLASHAQVGVRLVLAPKVPTP